MNHRRLTLPLSLLPPYLSTRAFRQRPFHLHDVGAADTMGGDFSWSTCVQAKNPRNDDVLSFLDQVEGLMRRIVFGLVQFFRRTLFDWIRDCLVRFLPIGKRLVLISVWLLCWSLIAFGPLMVFGAWALPWTILTLVGSVWAVKHYRFADRRRSTPLATAKVPLLDDPQLTAAAPAAVEIKPVSLDNAPLIEV